MGKTTELGEIAKKYLADFHGTMSDRSLAQKMFSERPDVFTSMEHARSQIRYHTGKYGESNRSKLADTSFVRKVNHNNGTSEEIHTDKKQGEFSWREWLQPMQQFQELAHKGKLTQDHAKIEIKTDKPICVVLIADLQLGAWSTDYDLFVKLTEEIKNTPNLYVALEGDLIQLAIKLRNVLEVSDNLLPPKWQFQFVASWLDELSDKLLWSGWCNHGPMREEAVLGFSKTAEILSQRMIYHNGIGHIDLTVGDQTYKIAATHFFRGRSIENPCHGQMRYMRREGIDREIALAGDSHVPGMVKYTDGGQTRLALNCGSIQTNSGYAKRFFSLTTHPVFPCFTLDPKEHLFTPFWSVAEWLRTNR